MLVSKQSYGLPTFLRNDKYLICFALELKEEIFEALTYLRNKKRINQTNLKIFSDYISEAAVFFEITSNINICRDPKDNFLLSLSVDAQADYLLTNDPDLADLKQFGNTIICTLPDFINKYMEL